MRLLLWIQSSNQIFGIVDVVKYRVFIQASSYLCDYNTIQCCRLGELRASKNKKEICAGKGINI